MINVPVLEVLNLWDELQDIPFEETDDGELILENDWESKYFLFPKGTEREEIWHWFDEHYEIGGVHTLLYESGIIDKKEYRARLGWED